MSWQLWLAREIVQDNPLPWQKHQTALTPGRVAQGFTAILVGIGTPAGDPTLNSEESLRVGPLACRARRELATQL